MHLLIRADASSRIGTGHVMRCLALAEEWQSRGGKVTFLSFCESESLVSRIQTAGVEYISVKEPHPAPNDLSELLERLKGSAGCWVVLDGYHFTPEYQRAVRDSGHRLLVVDDIAHLPRYHADILLNQNITATKLAYDCNSDAMALLGTKYALLRPEFASWRNWQRDIPERGRKLLVTLGGSDPDNVTFKVMQGLQELGDSELGALILVGYSNPNLGLLEQAVSNAKANIRVVTAVSDMPQLMAWADMAISAAGSTSWELAFMGLPSLMLVVADNQREIAAELDEMHVAVNLGDARDVTPQHIGCAVSKLTHDSELRKSTSKAGRRLVDGAGAGRVVSVMTAMDELSSCEQLTLREANSDDAHSLWLLANDATVRANSFSPKPIPYEAHIEWYNRKLSSQDTRMWILELADAVLGQIRYDVVSPDVAEIDYSVASAFRGKGLGTEILKRSIERAFDKLQVERIRGIVRDKNLSSARVFEKLGFLEMKEAYKGDRQVIVFEKRRQ